MYGFIKVAAATPKLKVANCKYNTEQIIHNIKEAESENASVIVFPELSITGFTCGDLFLQSILFKNVEKSIKTILNSTKNLNIISIVGAPISVESKLYNAGIVIYKGNILGIVPKTFINNYNKFDESRYFTSIKDISYQIDEFAGCKNIILSNNMLFKSKDNLNFKFAVEISTDINNINSPTTKLAQKGVTIILNLAAINKVVSNSTSIKSIVKNHSERLCVGYVLANAGVGESTTDFVFTGSNIIAEDGKLLNEGQDFKEEIIYSEIDTEYLYNKKTKILNNQTEDNLYNEFIKNTNIVEFNLNEKDKNINLTRKYNKNPFFPYEDAKTINSKCEEILHLQARALVKRLEHIGTDTVVLGLSGGLDSTLALIVCVRAFNIMGISKKKINAITMPCFGTMKRTKSNAEKLAEEYDITIKTIDITKSVRQHFKDIGQDETVHDITFENGQARERTKVLMNLANKYNGIVVGTGDLSELALGFTTYNGDHMSMYNVNVSIPKTLVRILTKYEAEISNTSLKEVLLDVVKTPISPELIPSNSNNKEEFAQQTEKLIGPYELHDFFLYYFVNCGFTPKKILYLAENAFKNIYNKETIKKWLILFLKKFFINQFKRSCLPDGPSVTAVSLSPRGSFKMPSDGSFKMWIEDLEEKQS